MELTQTTLSGVYVLKPKVWRDHRGYFFESFRKDLFAYHGINTEYRQDNESLSAEVGVLRGLHFQAPPMAQAKLVRVIKGAVRDVAVDIRRGSPTYGHSFQHVLTEDNKEMLYIPEGFAHGFVTLAPNTIFSYKCSDYYSPEHEHGIAWNDPHLNIDWQCQSPILSDKDRNNIAFIEFDSPFSFEG
jgi:dTDP-4-dehydrorhamnose 3,5-epimerase